jgi:prepilin-type processing-associated H-X9-DG protein
LLVVIAIIAVLMAVLMPALKRARESGKRAVCFGNVKQLALAWTMYIDDNDEKLVNGAMGYSNRDTGWGHHLNELAWVDTFSRDWDLALEGIRNGALYPYVKTEKLYRCPTGRKGEALTYSIMFSMNAVGHDAEKVRLEPGVYIKRRTDIRSPGAALRLVFIDEGYMSPDGFAVHYASNPQNWWDDPPVRHGDGTIVSFADGHVEYWRWKAAETIKEGRLRENAPPQNWAPQTEEGIEDLHRMQRGCWGKLWNE